MKTIRSRVTVVARLTAAMLCLCLMLSACGHTPTEGTTQTTTVPDTTASTAPSTTVPTTAAPVEINLLEDADVKAALDAFATNFHCTALQVAVVKDGKVAGNYAYGWATLDEEPLTMDHKIRIASVSKVFTGMAVMIAAEQGYVNLDTDIGTYWGTTVRNPSYPDTPITLDTLLTHTSSITPIYGFDYSSRYEDVLARFEDHYDATRPGDMDSWIYNNYGFHIAGMTAELASGKHLDTLMEEALFTPMDIDASFYSGDIQATDKLVTRYNEGWYVMHTIDDQLAVKKDPNPGQNGTHFAGGLTISAGDLAKLMAMMVEDGQYEGQQLLNPETIEAMERAYEEPIVVAAHQARPLLYQADFCNRDALYFHSGNAHGVRSLFSYDPVEKDGVVVVSVGSNTQNNQYDVNEIGYDISTYLYTML